MNEELKQELGTAAVAFTEQAKRIISNREKPGGASFWLNAEIELCSLLQGALVKHKDKHSFEDLIFYSLLMGKAVEKTMFDLRTFATENENSSQS